ncbi:M48 family metallopeptidase [Sphingomonas sp. H160509]|uniref:M48 family metallopeptidase n=1 Tax=Sphingomonas sp. H160509 TaxID=2955313 RepID=UPI002097668F|nr:M48 family metallopeptidase [Sphingomonas sp. H160509]MDD1453301.1 M48 family metallopeptidase [Sphingomonas sp. H160509]
MAVAQGFDVEQATRAYLDLLHGPARVQSDAYFEGGYWLILWSTLVAWLVYWAVLATGFSARLRTWAEARTKRRALATMLYGVGLTLVTTIAMLPWSIYTGFVREAQYGLMSQSFALWSVDQLKALVLALIVTPLAFAAIYAVIRRAPRLWWVWGAGMAWAFALLASAVLPVLIAPLFFTMSELPAGPLRERIVAMARTHDIPAEHIYVADLSRQTKRISANVSGLGPTVQITLTDNLLSRTSPDEVASVMGHEMGHYVLGHVWRNAAWFAVLFLAMFFAVAKVTPIVIARHPRWRVEGVSDVAAAPALLLVATLVMMLATPFQSAIVRSAESEADAFGLDVARQPDAFALIAIRLSEYRKLEPGPIEEFLFFDHPSGETRIRRAMQWKKDHVSGATMVKPVLRP